MAKSRSESPLRVAEGKRTMPGPGKKSLFFVIARSQDSSFHSEQAPQSRKLEKGSLK